MGDIEFRLSLPLEDKIAYSKRRIREWYDYHCGEVVVSYSGGKDSIVLLHLVRSIFPEVEAIFFNTGLEYPEIMDRVNRTENLLKIRPKMTFRQVLDRYGYPIISKAVSQAVYEIRNTNSEKLRNKRLYGDSRGNGKLARKWQWLVNAPFKISGKCCTALKKRPSRDFYWDTGKVCYVGTKIEDSSLRRVSFKRCNNYDHNIPTSLPLSFWRDSDIWGYIDRFNLDIPVVYDRGLNNTGCIFCLFGYQYEIHNQINRLSYLEKYHPKLYRYCMDDLGLRAVTDYLYPYI